MLLINKGCFSGTHRLQQRICVTSGWCPINMTNPLRDGEYIRPCNFPSPQFNAKEICWVVEFFMRNVKLC